MPRPRRRPPFVVAPLLAVVLALASRAMAATPAPALSDPDELRRWSAEVAASDSMPAVALLREITYTFDDSGRVTRTRRFAYRMESDDFVADWGETAVEWQPWYQAAPALDAQVLVPRGAARRLDPATVSEASVPAADARVYTDSRRLRAPLPGVARGAIVEEVSAIADTLRRVPGGELVYLAIGETVPLRLQRVVVDLPERMPFEYRLLRAAEPEIRRESAAGRRRITFTFRSLRPRTPPADDLPSDVAPGAVLVLSTGRSWQETAAGYAAIVEAQLAGDPKSAEVRAAADSLRRAAGPAASPDTLLEAAIRWLQRDVRYTSVGLGQAAIRPAVPSATLERRYGDCKDKATLLIALLRALGLRAEPALMLSGAGFDLLPELPGWGSFDHLVVHVAGPPERWVDATDTFGRAGSLPTDAQGRWALVAARGTRALVRTPVASAADNRLVERREVFLSDTTRQRVVETSRVTGGLESGYRNQYGTQLATDLHERMDEYATEAYLSAGTVRAHTSDANDFGRPFELVVDVADARRAWCSLEDAGVAIPRLPLFGLLPRSLTAFDADSVDLDGWSGRRRDDLRVPFPATVEWHYRVVAPPGYVVDSLPPTAAHALGPVAYRQEFTDSGSVVVARLSVSPQRTRLTPADVQAFQSAYAALLRTGIPVVRFVHRGLALVGSGELPGGLEALRGDVTARPGDAAAHMRLSLGLLNAALGAAARDEARRATELAPGNAATWDQLAAVRSFDLVGRPRHRGWDRAGAIAATRRALELEPSDSRRAALATLLEHSPDGVRAGTGADLDEAIRTWRALPADFVRENELDASLPTALLAARRFDELERWAREPGHAGSAGFLLAAVAAQRGPDAAITESRRVFDDDASRSDALTAAGRNLLTLRRYQDAGALFRAASRGRPDAAATLARADMIASVKPYTEKDFRDDDPKSLLPRVMASMLLPSSWVDGLRSLFVPWSPAVQDTTGAAAALGSVARNLGAAGMSIELVLDFMTSSLVYQVEGDERGCRVRATAMGNEKSSFTCYCIREDGRWRLIDLENGDSPSLRGTLAVAALRALDRADTASARRWLQWSDEPEPSPDDGGFRWPYARAFLPDSGPVPVAAYRLAAASLLAIADSARARTALALLDARSVATLAPAQRDAAQLVRARAFARSRLADSCLAALAGPLAARPDAAPLLELQAATWLASGRADVLRREAEARLARSPDDAGTLRRLMRACDALGDLAGVRAYGARLEATQRITPADYNNWAWSEFALDASTDTTVQRVNRSVVASPEDANRLHTQACVYAARNRCAEARDVMLQLLTLGGLDEPDEQVWLVLGRMAEQYQLYDVARDAYGRVQRHNVHSATDIGAIAEHRLAALPAPARR